MGFYSRESTTLKTAVAAPMPSASVITAVIANPGDLRSMRSPYRMSCHGFLKSSALDETTYESLP